MKTILKTKTSTFGLMAFLVSLSGCLTNKETKVVQVPAAPGPQSTVTIPSVPTSSGSGPAAPASGGRAAPTSQGPITDGGGNITNQGEVFDVVEDRGLVEIDLKQEAFYAKVLVPKFAEWNRILIATGHMSGSLGGAPIMNREDFYPYLKFVCDQQGLGGQDWEKCKKDIFLGVRLGHYLRSRLASRKWYLEDGEIGAGGCVNRSMIAIEREIAACQDDYEVRISRKAWNKMDDANKAALVTHELLLTIARQSNNYGTQKEVAERAVRVVNRMLQAGASAHAIKGELMNRSQSLIPAALMSRGADFIYDKGVEMFDRWYALLERKACAAAPGENMGDLLADSVLEIEKSEGLDGESLTGQAFIDRMKKIEASYGADLRFMVASIVENEYSARSMTSPIRREDARMNVEELRKVQGFFNSGNVVDLCDHFKRPSP